MDVYDSIISKRSQTRTLAMHVWQHRWARKDEVDRWTTRLVPISNIWLAEEFTEVDFYTTRFLVQPIAIPPTRQKTK